MQMTTEARAWLDATVRRILARHPLGDAERAGITYELMSHLHAAGETHAKKAGHAEVSQADLEAALAQSGGEDGLAAAFVQPLAMPMQRVLFWRRAGAFGIDVILIGIILAFVHNALTFLLAPLLSGPGPRVHDDSLWGLMPWGYHNVELPIALQAMIGVASAIVVMGYFTLFEAREGRSLGKRVFGLRVMRADGRPMTYREAFIRNLVKVSPILLVFDTIIMLIAFRREKQRVSDKIAETIVVRG